MREPGRDGVRVNGGLMGALGRQAVVLGASVGGLLAARVLADSFAGVTVVERDVLRGGAATRRGTPLALHPHAQLTKVAHILDQLFPGLLVDHGVQVHRHDHRRHRAEPDRAVTGPTHLGWVVLDTGQRLSVGLHDARHHDRMGSGASRRALRAPTRRVTFRHDAHRIISGACQGTLEMNMTAGRA